MKPLFVLKSIAINAPASKVWEIITMPIFTNQWALEFSSGGPQFHIESDWKLGSAVLWKGEDDKVIVEGNVTAIEPNKFLRYTVFDVRSSERPAVNKEDGITFLLSDVDGKTKLDVKQGDFSSLTDGQIYYDATVKIWNKVLPKIRNLAEGSCE